MPDIRVISHYGTKGMRWGVRKARGAGSRFLKGDPSTSLIYPKGRKAAVTEGKAAVGKLSGSKGFKTLVFDKNNSVLTKSGRSKLTKQFKKNAEKRFAKAEKKAAGKKAAAQKRAKDTKKLIKTLVRDDKASAKKWGKKFDEASANKYWNKLFEKELTIQDEY
jgi:hypothetical protein